MPVDVPGVQVTCAAHCATSGGTDGDPKNMRHIQVGECVRKKSVSRRLLALSEGEIATLMMAKRHVGCGSQGGAEALAIFHQLVFDEWMAGSLEAPLP